MRLEGRPLNNPVDSVASHFGGFSGMDVSRKERRGLLEVYQWLGATAE